MALYLYTDAAKRGETHIVSLYAECVNEEYLSEGGVLDEVLGLPSDDNLRTELGGWPV